MRFRKVLIANRGEIAVRVVRACHEAGLAAVAVYSDPDRSSLHVRMADEASHIGRAPSNESYLNIDRILGAARKHGADAIHPGYGFLSENEDFARACRDSNIIFIGPSPEAIEIMGSKLAAKDAVKKYNIPLVPGTDYAITDIARAKEIAREVGFPVLIKASAGGGGKGMRIVSKADHFEEMMRMAVKFQLHVNRLNNGS